MCGRATLTKKPKAIEERYNTTFKATELANKSPLPNYNIAPTHWHPVLTNETEQPLRFFKWGLIPPWAKDAKIASKLINARIETILEKPAFKSIHQKRCLVPYDGFYEWKRVGKERIPYRIILPDTPIFSVAGIWETWASPSGEIIPTFTVLTQPPNELMQPIHNRMPAILSPQEETIWLDNTLSIKDILATIQPYPSELMKAYRVSNQVNKVKVNNSKLLEEVPDFQQGSLF